jgi:[ribosomal protein S5]-alanine N-acetyltransferase
MNVVILPAEQPLLETPRLRLRPMRVSDAQRVQQLAGDERVALSTELIPHPYPDGAAQAWIEVQPRLWREAREGVWAIAWRESDELIGALSLSFALGRHTATVGYWVGHLYWGRGVATEALRAATAGAFDQLGLHRLQATHRTDNPASGRVMEKAGWRFEGVFRESTWRSGRAYDSAQLAVLATDPR